MSGRSWRLLGFVVAAAAAVGATAAWAADLPAPMAPPPAETYVKAPAPLPVYPYNWRSVYIGVNGGYGFGTSDWLPSSLSLGCGTACSTGNFDIDGGLAGATLGANFQVNEVVFGIESDIDWANIHGSASITNPCAGCETSDDWLGTVRGRIGYALDRVLLYATGGGAFGDVRATVPAGAITGCTVCGGSNRSSEFGWTAGGGLEYGISENWTAKIEYLFVDLSNATCTLACNSPTPVAVQFETSMVRAGVNFKFRDF